MNPSSLSSLPTSVLSSSLLMVLRMGALIALHVIAEEERDGDGCHVPGLGDFWKMGCPKSPMRESEGEACSEDESVSSGGSREGCVCNDALRPGGKISLFLQDWELAKMALSCLMAMDMLCQEMHGDWQLDCRCKEALCHSKKSLSLNVDGL